MIYAQLHPLDEITRFGHTCHGLMTPALGTVQIDATPWPMPDGYPTWNTYDPRGSGSVHPDYGDTHIIRGPAPELEADPEEQAAERAAGIVWQTYSLLSSTRNLLYGHHLDGWIYVDPAGARWLVKQTSGPNLVQYGTLSQSASLSVELTLRPFGELDAPEAEPVVITASLADIGQADPPDITAERGATLRLRTTSISSDGSAAIIALYPSLTAPAREADPRDLPYGFLRLTLSGVEGTLAAALTVEHSRAETLGARTDTSSLGQYEYLLQLQLDGDIDIQREPSGNPVRADGEWSCTGITEMPIDSPVFFRPTRRAGGASRGSCFLRGANVVASKVERRICGAVFDADDSLVLITADIESTSENEASYTATASGSYVISGLPSSITGSVSVEIWRSVVERKSARLAIYAGDVVDEYRYSFESVGDSSHVLTLGTAPEGSDEEVFGSGTSGGIFYNLEDGSATDRAGISWDMPVLESSGWSYVGIPASDVAWISDLTRDGIEITSASGAGYGDFDAVASIAAGYARVGIEVLAPDISSNRYRLDCQRLCNQMHLVRIESLVWNGAAPVSAHSRAVLTPRGLHDAGVVRPHALDRTRVVGSYEPVTGAVWVGYTDESWPTWRCWV